MSINPYEILKVSPTATQDELKAAYRKLAKKFHPDLNPGNKEAELRFKNINAAYALVDSAENRAKYDQGVIDEKAYREGHKRRGPFYSQTQQGGGRYSSQFEGFDPEAFADIFESMGSASPFHKSQPQELYQLSISFKDSILGVEREITFPSGKKFHVKIPAGVESGAKLRFAGKGEGGGDVYVQLQVLPSANFKRVGQDIETEIDVPFDKAILGGEIKVTTIDGSILLKVPEKITAGQKMRVSGKGVPYKDGKRGALIVKLNIKMPEHIDEEFKKAVAAWSARQKEHAPVDKESV